MKENIRSQKGLTLIEVLISIVLLSVILISFMGFMTQSAMFNQKNKQKIDTMQTAQKFIDLIEIDDITKQDLQDNSIIDSNENILKSNLTKSDLQALLDPVDTPYNVSAVVSKNSSKNIIMFKIIVQDANNLNKSETYTYIRR